MSVIRGLINADNLLDEVNQLLIMLVHYLWLSLLGWELPYINNVDLCISHCVHEAGFPPVVTLFTLEKLATQSSSLFSITTQS